MSLLLQVILGVKERREVPSFENMAILTILCYICSEGRGWGGLHLNGKGACSNPRDKIKVYCMAEDEEM